VIVAGLFAARVRDLAGYTTTRRAGAEAPAVTAP
jgi:hypothetical protein